MLSRIVLIGLIVLTTTAVFAQDGGQGDPVRGNRLFFDDFATFVNRWETAETNSYSVLYEEQALHFVLNGADTEVLSRPNNAPELPRFIMETQIYFEGSSALDSEGGLSFGIQNADTYYAYTIRPSGHYQVNVKQNGEWDRQPLVRGFFKDTSNRYHLGIQYDAGRYLLMINQEPVAYFFDDTLMPGEFGVFGATATNSAHIVFDDVVIYDLLYPSDSETDILPTAEPTSIPQSTPTPTSTPTPRPGPTEPIETITPPRI